MSKPDHTKFLQDLSAAVSVAAVTLSVSGAFGLLSGRGVLIGMLSAAVYQCISAAIGGTRVQCSGPTGPMTAIFIALTAGATASLSTFSDAQVMAFMSMVILFSGACLLVAGLVRLGNVVRVVPNVVISGFMDGIALIIWLSQIQKLFGNGAAGYQGEMASNAAVASCTVAVAFMGPAVVRLISPRLAKYVSGTLLALVAMTVVSWLLELPVGRIEAEIALHSWQEVSNFLAARSPADWPWHLWPYALPLAIQLAGVAYLDTLLTSLIIDRQTGTESRRNLELGAQSVATAAIACIGGLPGAQATERSVLLVKEGAKTRLAGVLTGVAALTGVLLLQDAITAVPQAVFAGILFKLGYDVFDWEPLKQFAQHRTDKRWHIELSIIVITAVTTVILNVMYAVTLGTLLFFLLKQLVKTPMRDLALTTETEGFTDEP